MKPGRIHPGVGVGAVVTNGDRLLMVLRDGAHGAGTWTVPGGWIEMWESPCGAAEREVREETGLTVLADVPMGWSDAQHAREGVHAVTLWVLCEYIGGIPQVVEPEKCPVVGWVPLNEVSDRPLFAPFCDWWPIYLEPFLLGKADPHA